MTLGVVLVLACITLPCISGLPSIRLHYSDNSQGKQDRIVGKWYDGPNREFTEVIYPNT